MNKQELLKALRTEKVNPPVLSCSDSHSYALGLQRAEDIVRQHIKNSERGERKPSCQIHDRYMPQTEEEYEDARAESQRELPQRLKCTCASASGTPQLTYRYMGNRKFTLMAQADGYVMCRYRNETPFVMEFSAWLRLPEQSTRDTDPA